MTKTIRNWLLGMMLLFSGVASAQTSQTNLESIKSALDPSTMSSYSSAQYSVIFGCPGGLFKESCDQTVFGYVAGQFNTIAFIMGVIVLLYIMIGGAINTAASGEVLGKSWSSAWLPIRVFMAFGLIIPTSNIAPYSPSQIAPMYAVIIGDNLATMVTKNIAQKVAEKSLTISGTPPKIPAGSSLEIAGSVFCAANEWNALTFGGESRQGEVVLYTASENDYLLDNKTSFPYSEMPGKYSELAGKDITKIQFGTSGKCGSMELPQTTKWAEVPGISGVLGDEQRKAAYAEVTNIVLGDMEKYAKIESEMRAAGLDDEVMELILKSGMEIPEKLVAPYTKAQTDILAIASTFQERVSTAMGAPFTNRSPQQFLDRDIIHYTDINKLLHKMAVYENAPNEAALEMLETVQNKSWDQCFAATKSCREKLSSEAVQELTQGTKVASTMMGMEIMRQMVGKMGGSSGIDGISLSLDDLSNPGNWLNRTAKGIKISILEVFSDYSEGDENSPEQAMNFSLNPMVLFHHLGTVFATIGGILTIILGGLSATASAAVVATPLYMFAQAIFMPLIYGIFAAGAMFVFITVIPIVVGIWGYLSIIIMAVQGVSAAPFAVVLLATPEGQGMMTSTFQRFLLHWTHLVLAPMIFVLGAVASLSLMIVGANIVVWTFIVDMNFYGSDSWLFILASIGIFLWVLYKLVMKLSMFQLTLQSEIMEILGGNFHKPLGHNMGEEALATGNSLGNAAKKAGAAAAQNAQRRAYGRPGPSGDPTPGMGGGAGELSSLRAENADLKNRKDN